ncbi:MAG: hypothetical protein QF570_21540 [Myxococcota bacterium]|jgi:hypothetical protein|nr:hypothetical protein [Myxococcota bacterium]
MIDEARRAEIRRLYYAEHWRIGTTSSELSLREVPLAQATLGLTRLLDDYGASQTDAALETMLERDTPSLASLALWLEQQRRKRHPVACSVRG